MNDKIESFKDLKIWQKGIGIVKLVYQLTESFPNKEAYGLTSQMRRSAISIPSNIAEGFKRYHNREFKQFLYIALSSAAELETQIIIARELDYINEDQLKSISEHLDHLGRMTTALIQKLNID